MALGGEEEAEKRDRIHSAAHRNDEQLAASDPHVMFKRVVHRAR